MVRNYKRKLGSRSYCNYTEDQLQNAIKAVRYKNLSVKKAAETFKIPRRTLENKVKKKHTNKPGRPCVFTKEEEDLFCAALTTVQKWGFPFEMIDFRIMIKSYLDKSGKKCPVFKNNYPGMDFCQSFMRRNQTLASRFANNMKRARATVTHEEMSQYFENLAETIENVPSSNIFNYDESNLSDDPGRKKVIAKRGSKYVDRIMNTSKSAHSVMFCGSADGVLLPIYTVYKSVELWNTWCEGGPRGKPFCEERCCAKGARFNRSKSGWFEGKTFSDWFFSTFLPHAKQLPEKKVLIGDNLSSHFTADILKSCEENDIAFVCLPANSTHICQPLDVSFFAPLKKSWRKILSDWKASHRRSAAVPKSEFPGLLVKLSEDMGEKASENLKSGFKTCGIFPLNKDEVLRKIPTIADEDNAAEILSSSVTEMLQEMRFDKQKKAPKKRKLLAVEPGKSISTSDIANISGNTEPSSKKAKKKSIKNKAAPIKSSEDYSHNNNEALAGPSSIPDDSEISDCSAQYTASMEMTDSLTQIQSNLLHNIATLKELGRNTLVAAIYENKWWLGKVLDVSQENSDVEIHFMLPSGPSQKFQWGGSDEKCWVPAQNVLGKVPSQLLVPGRISTRFFQIPDELLDEIERKFLKCVQI